MDEKPISIPDVAAELPGPWQPRDIAHVRAIVRNKNPSRTIRINCVAFTPATAEAATVWLTGPPFGLPREVPARDGDTVDVPIDNIGVGELGPTFRAWVELKTGRIVGSKPVQAPHHS
jgi:hypothetical protein